MILAIETAGTACSVALIDGDTIVAAAHEIVGRGHAEHLLPMIAALPDGGRADAIAVDCGPGSFTGIRVGIAAARGLGLGWDIPVRGYASLAMIAAIWFAENEGGDVTVAIDGGHGEIFIQPFARSPFRETAPMASLAPEAAASCVLTPDVAGNAAARIAGAARAHRVDLDARRAMLLRDAPVDVRPIYGRAPDAKPMA